MVYILCLSFILLDLVTGFLKAFKMGEFSSSVMREGLWHKCGSLLCICFGVLVDVAQMHMDLGVSVPVSTAICVYIVLMEIGSIIENICILNPQIKMAGLRNYFAKLKESEETK